VRRGALVVCALFAMTAYAQPRPGMNPTVAPGGAPKVEAPDARVGDAGHDATDSGPAEVRPGTVGAAANSSIGCGRSTRGDESARCLGTRVKDIAAVAGLGRHKLVGYGLVTGLSGTGDTDRAMMGTRTLANMLNQFGLTLDPSTFQVKNVAAAIVTAELPPIAPVGTTLDVTVSSIGDADSLQGGMLLVAPLKGGDGKVYAIAQGPISIGGFNASSGLDRVQKNHPTVGRIPNGASVTTAITVEPGSNDTVTLTLFHPDFTTAENLARAVAEGLGSSATATNESCVVVKVPEQERADIVSYMSRLESLPVEPDAGARVVINERTGTVVIGSRVRISPVAISQGGLTVEVQGEWQVAEGAGIRGQVSGTTNGGTIAAVPQQQMNVKEQSASIMRVPAQATLQDLVSALNALGVKPRDLIAIIQALKEAGALQAEVVTL